MHSFDTPLRREQGFVLITVLLILLVLTVLGFMATNNTTTELRIAGNEKTHKQTFYQADGGTELAERFLFANTICSYVQSGFSNKNVRGRLWAFDEAFADGDDPALNVDPNAEVSDSNREAAYYPGGLIDPANPLTSDTTPHTNFLARYTTHPNPGSGMQMVSGYEGLGGGSPSGTHRRYVITTQHHGLVNSLTTLVTQWRLDNSVVASSAASDCKF